MVTETTKCPSKGLIVGHHTHDVLYTDTTLTASTLGGASAFISKLLSSFLPCQVASKVGSDFLYSSEVGSSNSPVVSISSPTTLFHAHFSSSSSDRELKRVRVCDPIFPNDLPSDERFGFGMAVGVAGEILPETLERMLEICDVVFADVQSLIRKFDEVDGTVRLVRLKEESGFFHLLPRLGFLKASAEEAPFVDVEEVRKHCCVVVTNGKDGCTIYEKDSQECRIPPFSAVQVDPTGAGDCFLGGFTTGLVYGGLSVSDAALLGNFFGSLTVAQIGVPKFEPKLLQQVKDEMEKRKTRRCGFRNGELMKHQLKPSLLVGDDYDEEFHASLAAAIVQHQQFVDDDEDNNTRFCNQQLKLLVGQVFEELPMQAFNTNR